jgi:hypothetical protein
VGFTYKYIGRPATALDLMNTIRDNLVSVGWTLLREYTDASGNAFKFLRTASYLMPDSSDAGSAVLELRNPATTSHVDVRMWTRWNSTTNSPVAPNCPDDANGSYLRLAYSFQSGVYYWLYANEYWFALLASGAGAAPNADAIYNTIAGLALPPQGIPTAPPYKALFVAAPYNTGGSLIDGGHGFRRIIHDVSVNVLIAINPSSGATFWWNWLRLDDGRRIPPVYIGHPDMPTLTYPLLLWRAGEIKYARITGNQSFGVGSQISIGGEIWAPIIQGSSGGGGAGVGQIWARIQ